MLSTRLNDPFSNIHATPFLCKIKNLFERGDVVDNVYQILLCTEHCDTCRGAERKAAAILLWRIQLYASVNIIGNVIRLQKFLVF